MQKLTINRTNGNILKSLDGQDHISGLLFYVASTEEIPTQFATEPYKACSTLEKAAEYGITPSATGIAAVAYYHIAEVLRINPGVLLYVGFAKHAASNETFSAVAGIQQFAGGNIRQLGIYDGGVEISKATVTALQTQASALELLGQPLSIVISPKVTNISTLASASASNAIAGSAPNVSVMIGQDSAASSTDNLGGVGTVIGLISKAKVNESIAWVAQSETGISQAAFADGKLYRNVDSATIEALDAKRFLFFKTYAGLSGIYLNDSHNMDSATSDYNSIELERTMDKAVRGVRTYLLPELGRPIHFNTDGTLRADTLQYLKTVAGKAIEDMEKAGEVDGYVVEIDPEQNVQSTSTIEFVIKNIPVGVMRQAVVNIGYTSNL